MKETFKKGKVYLGKVDGYGNGKKSCKAFFGYELRKTDNGPEFSMSGNVWNAKETDIIMGGQACKEILQMVENPTDQQKRMVEIWERWHLNGMNAGCIHQRKEWDLDKKIIKATYSIDWDMMRKLERRFEAGPKENTPQSLYTAAVQLQYLNKAGIKPFAWVAIDDEALLKNISANFEVIKEHEVREYKERVAQAERDAINMVWKAKKIPKPAILKREETKTANRVRPEEHPDGLLCKPCHVCGYKYGSQWLYEEIPQEVINEIMSWGGGDTPPPEDKKPIEKLMQSNHIVMVAEKVAKNPNMQSDDKWEANHYACIFINEETNKSFKTYYSMGTALKGLPDMNDVLDCLVRDAEDAEMAGSFAAWAEEFGYTDGLRKAEKIYNTCLEQGRKLADFLGEELYQKLVSDEEIE